MKYRKYFEEIGILKESGEAVHIDGEIIRYNNSPYPVVTFIFYNDKVNNDNREWAAIRYKDHQILNVICSDKTLEEEIKVIFDNRRSLDEIPWVKKRIVSHHDTESIEELKSWIGIGTIGHSRIEHVLFSLKRMTTGADNIAGRIFERHNKPAVIAFWNSTSMIQSQEGLVTDMIKRTGYKLDEILFEDSGGDETIYVNYNTFFGKPAKELNDYEKKRRELERQLHMDKAKMDQALVQAIQGYKEGGASKMMKALEKEFGMPFVKIKQKFEDAGIPLGQVVRRSLMERRAKKHKLLKESPDTVDIGGKKISWRRGETTFLLYDDLLSKKEEWVIIFSDEGRIEASKPEIKREMEYFYRNHILERDIPDVIDRVRGDSGGDPKEFLEYNRKHARAMYMIGTFSPTQFVHPAILFCLSIVHRVRADARRGTTPLSARLFKVEGNHYLSFWQDKIRVNHYKDIVMEWMRECNLDPRGVLYQPVDIRDSKFLTYDELFSSNKPERELSSAENRAERNRVELARKLHMMQLPGGWKDMMRKLVVREMRGTIRGLLKEVELRELFNKPGFSKTMPIKKRN